MHGDLEIKLSGKLSKSAPLISKKELEIKNPNNCCKIPRDIASVIYFLNTSIFCKHYYHLMIAAFCWIVPLGSDVLVFSEFDTKMRFHGARRDDLRLASVWNWFLHRWAWLAHRNARVSSTNVILQVFLLVHSWSDNNQCCTTVRQRRGM